MPKGGICMMGGATEDDNAMRWFLERASGGDVLIMRASGSDGYNDYFFKELGVSINSVETLVFHGPEITDTVLSKIDRAEAIWFAGGDQETYLSYWKGNAINAALQKAIDRGVVIGGTSAGMAILGEYIWDGERIRNDFLRIPFMENTITDTHYDARNRYDRHLGFISEIGGKGIAADEYTAICIDTQGLAKVFGDPSKEDFAYFIDAELNVWQRKGDTTGSAQFHLSDW